VYKVLFSFVLFLISHAACLGAGITVPQEATDAWSSYRNAIDSRGVVIKKTVTEVGTRPWTELYRWSSAGESLETDMEYVLPKGASTIASVVNHKYSFEVNQSGGSNWALRDLRMEKFDYKAPPNAFASFLGPDSQPALWGLQVGDSVLPDAITDGLITVESMEETNKDGLRIVELKIKGDLTKNPYFRVARGILRLAPDFGWMIVEQRVELLAKDGSKGTIVCENSYSNDPADLFASDDSNPQLRASKAFIKHSRHTLSWDVLKRDYIREIDFEWQADRPQESDFTLTHYGLKEPMDVGDSWSRRVFLIAICTAVIVIAAVQLLRRSKSAG